MKDWDHNWFDKFEPFPQPRPGRLIDGSVFKKRMPIFTLPLDNFLQVERIGSLNRYWREDREMWNKLKDGSNYYRGPML